MKEGLYKVEFHTALGRGAGVVSLREGQVRGGDSMMYYSGSYKQEGQEFTAHVSVAPHTEVPGMTSVLGVNRGALVLQGHTPGDTTAVLTGTSPQAPPDVRFSAELTFLLA